MAFTFQDMYMGLSPYESPATYSLMQYTELADGLWYPMGGMYRVAEALTGIAEKLGVRFPVQCPGGEDPGRGRSAPPASTWRMARCYLPISSWRTRTWAMSTATCCPMMATADRIDRKEYGCSTIMFYWGLDKQYPQLGPHNLFLCGDYRQSFEDIFKA